MGRKPRAITCNDTVMYASVYGEEQKTWIAVLWNNVDAKRSDGSRIEVKFEEGVARKERKVYTWNHIQAPCFRRRHRGASTMTTNRADQTSHRTAITLNPWKIFWFFHRKQKYGSLRVKRSEDPSTVIYGTYIYIFHIFYFLLLTDLNCQVII